MRNFSPPSAAQQKPFFNGVRWGSWKISGWHTLIIWRLLAFITWSKSHLMRESTCRVSDRLILLIFTLSTSKHGLAHWRKNGMTLHFRNPLLLGVRLAVICKPKQDQDMSVWEQDLIIKLKPKPNQIKYNMRFKKKKKEKKKKANSSCLTWNYCSVAIITWTM